LYCIPQRASEARSRLPTFIHSTSLFDPTPPFVLLPPLRVKAFAQ
jgi:hypothetical protein